MKESGVLYALAVLLVAALLAPSQADAQYLYLDSNGNGVHDSGDQVNGSGSTTADIWLDTDTNRNGTSASCATGGQALSILSYTVCLRVIGGGVSWGTFTNQRSTFTTAFPAASDSTQYYNGFGGATPLTAGTYKLATITFSVTSGAPSIAPTPSITLADGLMTSFGSDCTGVDFDNTLKLGSDWHDADGLRQDDTWPYGGVPLAPAFLDQGFPAAAADGAGGAIVAWQEGTNPYTNLYVNRINGSGTLQWGSAGVPLCTAGNYQRYLRSVPDASGGAIFVWQDERNAGFEVFAQRMNSSGTAVWATGGINLCTGPGGEQNYAMISDGAGGAFVAWIDTRSGTSTPDIYAQHMDSLGVLGWTNTGAAVCTATGAQGAVDIARDGSTGAIFTWADGRSGGSSVYAQRLNSSGVAQWQTDGVRVDSLANASKIVPDGSGGAIIVYQVSGDIFARKMSSGGTPQWAVPTTLCNATGTQDLSTIISDGAGGAIAAWEDSRSGSRDVYAARVRNDSLSLWSSNGVAVCTAPNDQYHIQLAADGAGGAALVWQDNRDESYGDIYMQRLNPNGTPLWNQNGTVVAKETYVQEYPVVVSDGSGGAIAAWADYRNNFDLKVYAMRIKASGHDVTGVDGSLTPSFGGVLRQNYPNPFNPSTTISFDLAQPDRVAIRIYSVDGRLVRTLVNGFMSAGTHRLRWDGRSETGSEVATGVYVYRLEGRAPTPARSMVLIR